jgi:hypothetical protein
MRVSTPPARWFSFFLLLIAGTIGCAAPGTGVPASPTAPTLASGATNLGPGASYDGSGLWHANITQRNLTTNEVLTFEFDIAFTQDTDGNLHASDDGTVATLTRRGSGLRIAYDMSVFESHPSCNTQMSGSAQIDTATNTLTAKLSGLNNDGQGCFRAQASLTATK